MLFFGEKGGARKQRENLSKGMEKLILKKIISIENKRVFDERFE